MSTTTERAQMARRDPAPVAHAIQGDLLQMRKQYVPHALNGEPRLDASVFARQAAQIRKDMQQGKSAEIRRALHVMQDHIEAGVPLAVVCSVLDQMRAHLALCAADRASEPRDLSVLVKLETRAQGRLDMAQLAVLERPTDAVAVAECVQAASDYHTRYDAFVRNLHARLAVLRGSTTPTVQVMR